MLSPSVEVNKRYISCIYTHDTDMYILVRGVDRCALVTHNNIVNLTVRFIILAFYLLFDLHLLGYINSFTMLKVFTEEYCFPRICLFHTARSGGLHVDTPFWVLSSDLLSQPHLSP